MDLSVFSWAVSMVILCFYEYDAVMSAICAFSSALVAALHEILWLQFCKTITNSYVKLKACLQEISISVWLSVTVIHSFPLAG